MPRLAPATAELHVLAATTILAAGARSAGILVEGRADDLRAVGLGLVAAVAGLWGLWAARAVRRAARLALPTGTTTSVEDPGATVARVLIWQVVPLCALAFVGSALAGQRLDTSAAAAAGTGALAGVGVTALLAAARLRRVERALGRRLLRRPGRGAPLGRRSLFIEPEPVAARAGAPVGPWPAHRPPPRAQRSAMELDPSNPAARHAPGVRASARRGRAGVSRPGPGGA